MKSGALNRSCIIYTCEYYVWRKRQQMKNLYFTFSKSGNFFIYHSDAVTPWRQRAEEKKNLQKNSQLKLKKKNEKKVRHGNFKKDDLLFRAL